jgi:hypothetical protein
LMRLLTRPRMCGCVFVWPVCVCLCVLACVWDGGVGIFIALLLRYDAHRARARESGATDATASFPKTCVAACLRC